MKFDSRHTDDRDDTPVLITRGLLDQLWRLVTSGKARLPDIDPGRVVEGIMCMPNGAIMVQYADGGVQVTDVQVTEEWPETLDG